MGRARSVKQHWSAAFFPALFDAVQLLIDQEKASFFITGSSTRKLRRKSVNLLPGRVKSYRLDPFCWNEIGWIVENRIQELGITNLNEQPAYSFEESMIFGTLPGIVLLDDPKDRAEYLTAYSISYLEEEIRAEALSRNRGGRIGEQSEFS